MKHINFIFSINVHEKKDFLLKQLRDLHEHVVGSYAVILNVNEYMNRMLKHGPDIYRSLGEEIGKNVKINPEIIEKQRGHGTLTKGIYSNMKLAIIL